MTVFSNDAFFKQKHLRVISENTFRGELILNCNRNWQDSALITIYVIFINRYIGVDVSLTAALGDILKVNLTMRMELRHWNPDKWEAIPSKIMKKKDA